MEFSMHPDLKKKSLRGQGWVLLWLRLILFFSFQSVSKVCWKVYSEKRRKKFRNFCQLLFDGEWYTPSTPRHSKINKVKTLFKSSWFLGLHLNKIFESIPWRLFQICWIKGNKNVKVRFISLWLSWDIFLEAFPYNSTNTNLNPSLITWHCPRRPQCNVDGRPTNNSNSFILFE